MSSEAGSGEAGFWTGDRVAGLALMAAAAAVAFDARGLPFGGIGRPGPGYTPLIYAGLLFLLGLVVAAGLGGNALSRLDWGGFPRAAAILLTVGFAAAAMERLGYRLTMLAAVAFLVGVVERRPALPTALASLALSFGTHLVFWTLLRVPLPAGPFGL